MFKIDIEITNLRPESLGRFLEKLSNFINFRQRKEKWDQQRALNVDTLGRACKGSKASVLLSYHWVLYVCFIKKHKNLSRDWKYGLLQKHVLLSKRNYRENWSLRCLFTVTIF